MTALIELKNVSRHYGHGDTVVRALDGVDLTIGAGEFIAIMGQSGSGKSTLMNIIGCLDRPSGGSYRVLDEEAAQMKPDQLASLRRRTFGFIFQRYNLLATASARENVEIPALYAGMEKTARRNRAQELLANLGLGARAHHRPSELSGGQQQRVAIARAIMNDPPVILADEPTGALDSASGREVMALLKDLNAAGRTVILITHDEQVAVHARRIVRIQDGRIVADSGADTAAPAPAVHPAGQVDEAARMGAEGTEAVTTALRSLRVNIFRTALTLLGIIIGVAAVITMLAIGNGSKQEVLGQINSLGTNLLNIRPGAAGVRSSGDNASLSVADAAALRDIPNVGIVVPERSGRKTLRLGNTDYAASIQGVGAGFPAARDWNMESGAFFTDADVGGYAAVIVLGKTVANTFFPDGVMAEGQYILVGNIPFQVIGVMEGKGAAPWGGDQDDTAYIPYTTALARVFGGNYLNSITVKANDIARIDATERDIARVLAERHGAEDFSVRGTASLLEMVTQAQNALTLMLGAVAAISLLVGGIGVMNIMLVSVTERTREIGIRMATGARRRDIMLQFSTEAAVVCLIGGVLGVALGIGAGLLIEVFGGKVVFTLPPVLLAFGCAVATGLIFGYLPARKASRLDPVAALSSE